MLNIEKLIDEVEILNYLEEFDTPTFKTQPVSNGIKLMLSFIPIVNNVSVYQCVKRTNMSLGQKIIAVIFATFPVMGTMLLFSCIFGSMFESLAAANLIPYISKFVPFLNKLNSNYSKENKIELQKIHDDYFLQFKQLKKQYPEVTDENKAEVAKVYGELTIKYFDSVINRISELYSTEMSQDDLNTFKDLKVEFNKIKAEVKKKDWNNHPLSQIGR